jgi:hypothetical protein
MEMSRKGESKQDEGINIERERERERESEGQIPYERKVHGHAFCGVGQLSSGLAEKKT